MTPPYSILSSWKIFCVPGANFRPESGAAVTNCAPPPVPRYWFSGNTTVVVGRSVTPPGFESPTESRVSWMVPMNRRAIASFQNGFLVIGCLRRFGGVHSRDYDKRVDVLVNGKQVDGFALRICPSGHSDYFHRVPLPRTIPQLPPFSECQTLYAWPIRSDNLRKHVAHQKVTVRIDQEVRWDIDHVGFLVQQSKPVPRVFLSHSHADKRFVRSLAAKLTSKRIKVWIDKAELRPGDSLIEKLRSALDAVTVVVAIISPASINSPWVNKEIEIATTQEIENRRLKVIPVLLNNCVLPGFLKGKIYADFTNHYRRRKILPILIRAIREYEQTR